MYILMYKYLKEMPIFISSTLESPCHFRTVTAVKALKASTLARAVIAHTPAATVSASLVAEAANRVR